MKTIEEQLWEYIDGNCSTNEKLELESKIKSNTEYSLLYKELLSIQSELTNLELEEPSMSFTRNIMDQVNLELKPIALNTKVDHRIIYGIGGFFILTLLSIIGYVISNSNLSFTVEIPQLDYNLINSNLITATSIKYFLIVDLVLALVFLDGFFRRRKNSIQKKKA